MSAYRPTPEQIEATDPGRSNWVGANAGSGKTHVLTQRVARLLLDGAAPNKILCLTYTKAAAAEMQARLFRTLGGWAMAPEAELAETLAGLSGAAGPVTSADRLAAARRLFAAALETPGGLKIQTIHAFCESLLRRFPFEARISPRFQVADDRQSDALLAEIREEMAHAATVGDDGFDRAARRLNEGHLDELTMSVLTARDKIGLPDPDGRLQAHFGDAADDDPVAICTAALQQLDQEQLKSLAEVLRTWGGVNERSFAGLIGRWLEAHSDRDDQIFDDFATTILTKSYQPRKKLTTKAVDQQRPGVADEVAQLTQWALDTRARLLKVEAARRSADLHRFGGSLIARYAEVKAARGLLDFDDLITLTADMLTRGGAREWVLFKLDAGIDHILVDEAQDTSPAQWTVVRAIADEFLAGEGARPEDRSLFVVGDEKQSIYSFQGADPKAFEEMRQYFDDKLRHVNKELGRPGLVTSFRSAPAILDFVDAVFQGDAAEGLTMSGETVLHAAHRKGALGRVDLWPLVPRPEKVEAGPWWEPVDMPPPGNAKALLAEQVSDHIAWLLDGEMLPAKGRHVCPDDILVLVSRRDQLAKGILRGLKARGIPVSGADRLKLSDEIAVKDLLALAKVAVMPSDDLSLAALLRSPLCGLSEDDLFAVAHGRTGTLWSALSGTPAHAEIAAFISDMMAQADFLRPYEFLMRALVQHDGRRNLLARLGAEAEDPIDELLAQALAMERSAVPSLAAFINWVEGGEQIVKREMDAAAGQVRVMTVHGAKGLEAPIVILPDTMSGPPGGGGRPLLLPVPGAGNMPPLMLWAGAKEQDDALTQAAREAAKAETRDERRRLLYVALTRAEDWLILFGAEPYQKPPDSWYSLLEAGMDRCANVQEVPSPAGEGVLHRFETGLPAPLSEEAAKPVVASPEKASWLVPAARETRVERLAPSGLVEHDPTGGAGLGRDLAMQRGTAVHALLEHPGLAADEARAMELLARLPSTLPEAAHRSVIAEAQAVLAMPEAEWIFGPDSIAEASVAIDPPRPGPRMIGRIDRLILEGDTVTIIDIKTDAAPPTAGEIPRSYLVQLGAYATALAPAFEGKTVRTAVLWTAMPRLDVLPSDSAEAAFTALRRGA